MRPLYLVLRNLFCGSIAIALIAAGHVRRNKRRAFKGDVLTSIYFHNPNKRLFTRCVRWLKQNGYSFISAEQLVEIQYGRNSLPAGAVWLSFDDGWREILTSVVPVACQQKIPITLFIPSGIVEGNGLFPWLHDSASETGRATLIKEGVRDSITVSELEQIARYPEVTIGSHTVNHAITVNLPEEKLHLEISESKRQIECWSGAPVISFAYPVGRFDGRESRLLNECGYEMAATTEAAFVTRESDPYLTPRFHVADNISFPEAICNMVGVWRPAVDPIIDVATRWFKLIGRLREPYKKYSAQAPLRPTNIHSDT